MGGRPSHEPEIAGTQEGIYGAGEESGGHDFAFSLLWQEEIRDADAIPCQVKYTPNKNTL